MRPHVFPARFVLPGMPNALGRQKKTACPAVSPAKTAQPPRASNQKRPGLDMLALMNVDKFMSQVGRSQEKPEHIYGATTGKVPVVSQREAGDNYCEHTVAVLNEAALQSQSSIRRGPNGDPMVGFIHLPGQNDVPHCPGRHAQTAEVVGAGVRGWVEQLRAAEPTLSPVKVLLSGFGPFGRVRDNPSGDLVSSPQNVDAVMKAAYGNAVTTPARPVQTPAGDALAYTVKDPRTGKTFEVQVLARRLEVDDSSIDGGDRSLQKLVEQFRPHAAMGLGIDSGASSYEVVVRSDRGALARDTNGGLRHDEKKRVSGESRDGEVFNDSLGVAIREGLPATRVPAVRKAS